MNSKIYTQNQIGISKRIPKLVGKLKQQGIFRDMLESSKWDKELLDCISLPCVY